MLTCLNGPAAGREFYSEIAPLFIRVAVSNIGLWSLPHERATIAAGITVHAYERRGGFYTAFLRGRHPGHYAVASYDHCPSQPDAAALANPARWLAWVEAQTA